MTRVVVDRIGPRRVALVMLLVLVAATANLGLAGPSIWSWYVAWAFFAFCRPRNIMKIMKARATSRMRFMGLKPVACVCSADAAVRREVKSLYLFL